MKPPDDPNRSAAAPESLPATRERIIRAASLLMQRQGYDGTGIKQISQEAQATLGSVYHFFPGGKQELALAAISRGDQEFVEQLRAALYSDPDPARAIVVLCRSMADSLRLSDWLDGCPITTTALGTVGRLPDIQSAAADAFARWRGVVFDRLLQCGVRESDARDLAHTVISTLEGAELAAQVSRSSRPLEVAGIHLSRLIASYR
ncbi:TetR/AcrR family transcriptional regulator [Streptomyces longwoodensis]|uniref:TetR/AcrR family transcriptional regulator n=1 Tax=Streptomyces lasalocidi TaxID=324833 RepID=A0A4U5WSM1_STRLS|nr:MULTISPECIES: TetR/AcrR family transcriptional regulator [Streptomyces]MCX4997816.1 TetR/AcrR family transcriptional regulator [Streptomyces longwoodensis]TKT05375.1 TetR/AcrR family transcriptional regulator [Streptomyces lasalocidi]WRY93203.1 TetR/AcrR family transcriptional regulator [Streptomyces longwoodensis]WTI49430.1 TetR/AcrR family transcriptional regulator [Streptomyces longwoodensis]WUC62322.1 TetR/AcrR family transcriptional regulator [Streptomyces longwoodensis]